MSAPLFAAYASDTPQPPSPTSDEDIATTTTATTTTERFTSAPAVSTHLRDRVSARPRERAPRTTDDDDRDKAAAAQAQRSAEARFFTRGQSPPRGHAVEGVHVSRLGDEKAVRGASLQDRAVEALRAAAGRSGEVAWGVDARPDRDNLAFGRLYAKSVPQYRRVSRRHVLGFAAPVTLLPESGKERPPNEKQSGPALPDRYFRFRPKRNTATIYVPAPRQPTEGRPRAKRSRWDSLAPAAPVDLELFVPLSTMSAAATATEPSLETTGGGSAAGETEPAGTSGQTEEERLRARAAALHQQLRREADTGPLWRELIALQDELVPAEVGRSPKLPAILAQRKMELYEQALQQLPNDDALLVDYLQQCASTLTPDELEAKWQHATRTNAGSMRVWQEYLSHASSNLSRFRVPVVQAKYHRCLEALDALRAGSSSVASRKQQPPPPPAVVEAAELDIFVASCYFQAAAGFQERALACFQAMLEANLRLPGEFRAEPVLRGQPLHYLEAFWESGVARYGEPGAPGFATWLQYRRASRPLPPLPADVAAAGAAAGAPAPAHPPRLHGLTEWQRWLEIEAFREQRHWQSWRPPPGTDEECEDPDRVALFDDVAGHLFRLGSLTARVELVLATAELLGASLPARVSSSHRRTLAAAQRLTRCQRLLQPLAAGMAAVARALQRGVTEWEKRAPGFLPIVAGGVGEIVDAPDPFRPGRARVSGMAIGDLEEVWGGLLPQGEPAAVAETVDAGDLAALLREAPHGWFPEPWAAADLAADGRASMALRVLEQAQADFPQAAALRMAYIDVLEATSSKRARKATKTMLKQPAHRSDLRLYARYARLEAAAGHADDAHKIYVTALQLAAQAAADASVTDATAPGGTVEACWECAAWHMQRGDANSVAHALALVVALVGGGSDFTSLSPRLAAPVPPPATAMARARAALDRLASAAASGESTTHMPPATTAAAGDAFLATTSCQLLAALLLLGIDAFEAAATAALGAYDQVLAAARMANTSAPSSSFASSSSSPSSLSLDELDWARERLYTRVVRMLLWQARRERIAPARLRTQLEAALAAYPCNPELLACLLVSEGRFHVAGRVHRHFALQLGRAPTRDHPVPWLFAIAAEVLRPPAAASPHRVRRLFERAVATRACRCPLVWRMFMEFERAQSGLEGLAKARGIFYQALQSCAGVKVLYLDAARHTPRQLQEVLDILQEKELHLRAPLEEIELIEAELAEEGEDEEDESM